VRRAPRIVALLAACLGAAACFSPDLEDGEIACGTAGCPEGMSCGDDGFCYVEPPPPDEGSSRRVVLAVANRGAPDRLYAYCGGELTSVWTDSTSRSARGVAAGDADGDGIPEVAFVSEEDGALVFRFDGGAFALETSRALPEIARDVAWGDVNGQYGIDLAIASSNGPLRVLSYHDGQLDDLFTSTDIYDAYAVDAEDSDGDGRAEIAVGGAGAPVVVYENNNNNNGGGGMHPQWSSDVADSTRSVDFGDVDGDGDLDLAVGNSWQPIRVYANQGDYFDLVWSSPDDVPAELVAWGDVDGDGDPDLAVGTGVEQPMRLYRNDGGELTQIWTADVQEPIQSIAWGDVDGDGDLDLAVGNEDVPSRLYRNDDGTLVSVWTAAETDPTKDIAWAIWDGGPDPCEP